MVWTIVAAVFSAWRFLGLIFASFYQVVPCGFTRLLASSVTLEAAVVPCSVLPTEESTTEARVFVHWCSLCLSPAALFLFFTTPADVFFKTTPAFVLSFSQPALFSCAKKNFFVFTTPVPFGPPKPRVFSTGSFTVPPVFSLKPEAPDPSFWIHAPSFRQLMRSWDFSRSTHSFIALPTPFLRLVRGPLGSCFRLPEYLRLFEDKLTRLPRGSGRLNRYMLIAA